MKNKYEHSWLKIIYAYKTLNKKLFHCNQNTICMNFIKKFK